MCTPSIATVPLQQLPRASRVLPLAKSIAGGNRARARQRHPRMITETSMRILAAMSLVIAASSVASAQTTASPAEPVTVENYNRAQTDVNFAGVAKNGGFGKIPHRPELVPPPPQGLLRPHRVKLYSLAVIDVDAGPVTITLPEAGKRFMGMQVVNEDQYTPATYDGAGTHTLTRQTIGTRYAIAVVRFLVDFSNKEDVGQVHA